MTRKTVRPLFVSTRFMLLTSGILFAGHSLAATTLENSEKRYDPQHTHKNRHDKEFNGAHKHRRDIYKNTQSPGAEHILVKGAQDTLNTYTIKRTSAATGLPLSLRETPQTVTVITRQLMDDMQINTLDDVMNTTAGVTSYQDDNAGRTTYRARGFDITNYRIDGMQVNGTTGFSGAGSAMNMDLYDNVQIIRGANGLMGGTGDPSATIYLERKQPTKTEQVNAMLRLGNWNDHRVMLDVNKPLNKSGTIRSRYIFTWEDSDTFRQRESLYNIGALANFAADLSRRDTVNWGFQYEKTRDNGASWGTNVPIWYANGARTNLPRSTNPVANWSFSEENTLSAFGNYDHKFSDNWRLRASYMHTWAGNYQNLGNLKVNNGSKSTGGYAGFWNEDGTGAYLNALHAEYNDQRDTADIRLTGQFKVFGRPQTLVFGFNGYSDELTTWTFSNALGNCNIANVAPYSACQYRSTGLSVANWKTWDGSYANFRTHRTNAREVDVTRNYGAYVSGHFVLAKGLSLILGGRMSSYQYYSGTYNAANAYTASSGSMNQNAVLTPYAGLVYDFAKNFSIYGSYTTIFTPQSADRDADNKPLPPVLGKSYETGVKGEFFDNRLNMSLAFYLNKQDNVAKTTGLTNTITGNTIYTTANGVTTEGVDFDVSGQITPGWNVLFGYSYLQEKGLGYQEDPHNLIKLNTTYTFKGKLHNLTIGGGFTTQTSTSWPVNPGRPLGNGKYDASNLYLNGYTLINLMARYRLTNWLSLTGNISNLTDKTYYRQAGFYDGAIYGSPRTFYFTLRGRY
ncbi:TonB-dependent siderophore receptor [Acetobacter sacchari]